MDVSCHRPFLPGTSFEPAVIPTPSGFKLYTAVLPVLCVMFQVYYYCYYYYCLCCCFVFVLWHSELLRLFFSGDANNISHDLVMTVVTT
jgi:hypothetical protein